MFRQVHMYWFANIIQNVVPQNQNFVIIISYYSSFIVLGYVCA